MAFKTVQSLDAEVTFAIGGTDKKTKKTNPKQSEGYYLGKRVVEGSKYGPSTIFFLQTEKGNVGIWGKTDLNNKMASVAPGCMIRITHAGMTPTPNGDMHRYKVEVDEDNTIDVSGLQSNTAAEYTQADDNSTDAEDTTSHDMDDDSDPEEESETAPEPVALPKGLVNGLTAEQRKAKVQSLLNSKNK